ncbi:Hypothetical protein, putative [Bodo saltans]|uniref:Uncharacterized protein n=1 Tax=Bodo saltans TaxID=75058 RepID=A0A0S4JNJ3_BODSA|nr:Hypothetical protein, putative [Bodo saltans]|eukprot:CUG93108.1 Hypothetical protein, putative [Bodo saltans]
MHVEHPTPANGLHRPIVTIRKVSQLPELAEDDGSISAAVDDSVGFMSYCETITSATTPYQVEQVAASWVTRAELMNDDDARRMWNLDEELPPPDTYGQPQSRHAVVGHVAIFARSAIISATTMDSSAPSGSSLRRNSSMAYAMQPDAALPKVADIPIVLTVEEWRRIMNPPSPQRSSLLGEEVLRIVLDGLDRGRTTVKSLDLDNPAPLVELGCSGPFAYLAVRERAQPTTSPRKGNNRRRSVTEQSSGHVRVYLADASCNFCVLPTFRRLSMVAPDGQRWAATSNVTAPSGNTFQCRPLYDDLSNTLHLAIAGVELAVVHVDWVGSEGNPHVCGRVMYFIEPSHLPSGESVSCAWIERSKVASLMHSDRGNMRLASKKLINSATAVQRSNDEEFALVFLREGHLCVMDVFVRKSATVVGTMPMLHRELDMMIRDEDIPDPTAGDPLLATRLPLKVLCGGLHRLCGVTSDGYLLRHNALHHATAVIDWTALCRIAAQHAEGPDEYGHIGGGISSRTLVCIPSSVLGNSSVGSSSPPVASPRGGMLINFNVPATNDPPKVRVATNSVLPEEFAATYVPPLRYDHKEPYNLVADARAPPRSTRLKGFLSRRNVPNDDPQTLAQLLHLFMDAMESNCTNPSQRDIRGRTAMHILADLFPHLSPADKQKWLDRLIKNNCNVFACDMAGESALDRPDVRSFLFRAMTNFSPDFEEDDEDEEVEDALPYRRHYASGLPAFEPLTVVGSSGSSTTESVVQTLWSRVSPSVLYIISDDGCLYRILCTTGSKQLLQRVPCCVAAMSTSTDQPQCRFVAAKVSAMLPSEATFEQGFPLPQDHQPADIILFNTGSVVIVYDPEGDATTHYEATGGFVWASSVSRSAAKGDPIAPSRLRAHEKQPHAPYDDCIDDMSSGFAPLCPSEQHAGIELVWFVRTGEAMLHPATTPVCMAVSARWFHVLQVVKLFAPRGINKVFPRHLSAMTATAVAHNIPVVPSRPERSLLRSHLNANGKSTGIDIHFYETARVDGKDGAAADACVTEVELQRFTQIVHAQHSPFGSVFFVTLQQGFISQECGVGELDVHIFSCPSFTPLGVVPIRSDFASSLAHQCEQFLNTSRGAFSLDIAKQQLWLALERQAASACLTVTDRTLSWCEGGGGMTVAKWDKQPGAAHKACAVVVTKGDHMFLRTPDHQGEMISVDRNIPGYHRRSGTHIAVSYGQLYSFDTSTGEAMCYGRLPNTGLTGDFSVSASTYHAASNTTTTNTASRGPILSAASFVAIHNQTTKSLIIISFERMQRVGRCFLHYTPMSIPLSNSGAGYDDDEAAIVPSSSTSDSEQIAMNAQSLVDELMRLEDTSELFTDPATLEARQSLKEVLEEQHDADMRRFDEQQMLAGMEASQRLTATSTPEDNDTIGTTSGLLQSKECHGHYWSRIQLLLPVTNESTTTAASVAREYPRICETEEELRTVERLYVTMLWPVLRGVLPLTGAVDGNGRTILMYHVMFYASYFKWVDAAAPRNKTLSRKYLRNVATRWERMKEEWRQLLTLGASVHLTDHYGCSLERHYLPLHSKVGTVLKSISSSLSAVPLGPVTASSEVNRRPPTSALAQWRQEQRSAPAACRGTSILCTLHSGDHANAGFDLALHTSQCCVSSGSAAFIAPVGLIDDHLWEDEPSASSSSALASQVAVIQLPWARNSVILMTPNSVMAIQHAGGSVATSSTAIRGLRSDLSRVDDSVASLEEAKESATSRSGGTKALFRKFTVPLRWSKADPKRRVKFSHWMSLDINGNTIFQFCGWSGAPLHTHHLTPFLRMWSCPQSFLHAESMSSLAQYVAKQLDDVTEAHVITQMNYVGCHSPTSLSQVGCVAFGNTVLFVSNGYVYAAQGTEALKNKSLLVPLESLDSACALVTLDNTMDIGRIAGAIEGSRDGNVKKIVDGRVIVRLAPDGCCCIPTPSGLLYCRVRQAHQHNGTSSQPIVVPSALIPTVCTLGDDISAPFMLADWRTTPSVMPSVADAPPSPALLLFAQQQTTDDVTPPFVAVAVNVRNDATCGSAVQWMSRLDQAMENVPLRQVLDAVLEDTDLEKSWRLDNRVEAAPHQQAHDDVAKTSRCGCFGAFSIPSA